MERIKENILATIAVFAVCGYLITANQQFNEFFTSQTWLTPMLHCGTLGEFVALLLCVLLAILYVVSASVYALKWYILTGILILWISLYASRRA